MIIEYNIYIIKEKKQNELFDQNYILELYIIFIVYNKNIFISIYILEI